jgi:uncharacterized protein with FMN-binding domain
VNDVKKRNPAIIALIVIVLLAIAAGAVYLATRPSDDAAQQTTEVTSSSQTEASDSSQSSESNATYKDGTYTATGTYSTPGGRESIDVSVTIENGIITDTSATGSANNGDSAQYQGQFLDNYRTLVVSRSIDDVNLSRVAGSSLTSNGFNNALEEIAQDARA